MTATHQTAGGFKRVGVDGVDDEHRREGGDPLGANAPVVSTVPGDGWTGVSSDEILPPGVDF
jgi:hypothetical protein